MTDMCILMTAAVCHDLDHPGYNNTYVADICPTSFPQASLLLLITLLLLSNTMLGHNKLLDMLAILENVDILNNFLNRYQINARTELAVRYNDISPLENHHCAVTFQILSMPECNIFANIEPESFKQIRQVQTERLLAFKSLEI